MKITRLVNLNALKDSFVLIRKHFKKKEEQEREKAIAKISFRSIGDRVNDTQTFAVSRSSEVWDYYNSPEYAKASVVSKDPFGNAIVLHSLGLCKKNTR